MSRVITQPMGVATSSFASHWRRRTYVTLIDLYFCTGHEAATLSAPHISSELRGDR
jgi:hypothetical protein